MKHHHLTYPVNLKSNGARVTIVEMELPDEAFAADGKVRHGYVIPNDVRCLIEETDMGRVTRRYVCFDETVAP